MRIQFLICVLVSTAVFSSCNTLANRRALFSPEVPGETVYSDSLAGNPNDSAQSAYFRKRYQRTLSTPAGGTQQGTYAPSDTYDTPTYTSDESPSSEDTYDRLFRKRSW